MGDYDWGQAGKGAIGGAGTGAMVGSAFGPVGTAVGGIAGGLIGGAAGLFSSKKSDDEIRNEKMLMDYYNQVQGRNAPQMGPASQAGYSAFRDNQRDLITRLEAQSKGQGPSLAAEQFKANTDRLGSQQASIANSGRGGPLAAQTAANNTALIGSQASQGAVAGRIAEQNNALQQLGMSLYSARGADEEMNRFNTNAQNSQAQTNLEARLRTMGYNDQAIQRVLSELTGSATAQAGRVGEGDAIFAGGMNSWSQMMSQRMAAENAKKTS